MSKYGDRQPSPSSAAGLGLPLFRALSICILSLWVLIGSPSGAQKGVAKSDSTNPQRIVALAPNVVELLFELGLGDRVVGVGNYCQYPPEVVELPRLGGLVDPHLESIVALRPDLVVTLLSEEKLADHVERLGVPVLRLEIETLDEIVEAAKAIGRATGETEAAKAFAENFTSRLSRLQLEAQPSVLIVFGRPPGDLGQLMTTGAETYVTELLSLLGATNAMEDVPGRYPRIGMEVVLHRDPDRIIELQWSAVDDETERALIDDWSLFTTLEAVRESRISVIAGDHTVIPGPRLLQLYDELASALAAQP